MQNVNQTTTSVPTLTPNADKLFVNPNGRGSVEYAKARIAIESDYQIQFASNQAMAKRMRRDAKHKIVSFLNGEVSRNEKKQLVVTFKDGSIARL